VPGPGDDPRLLAVRDERDILPAYRDTPVGRLLRYHKLAAPQPPYLRPELLIVTCMDYRVTLRLPERFAFVLRAAGANLRWSEFMVSCAIALGGVQTICIIAHDDCVMSGLATRREAFVAGLVRNAGWSSTTAAAHFDEQAPSCDIGDPAMFVRAQATDLSVRYPRVIVAPLLYSIGEGLLYQVTADLPRS
jgi:carbonic anhydrase